MSSILRKEDLRSLHPILVPNWRQIVPNTIENLIDTRKLVQLEGRSPLAKILNASVLEESDKTIVKNIRDRLNRKKATRKFRERNKLEDIMLAADIDTLSKLELELINCKKELRSEIDFYKYQLQI